MILNIRSLLIVFALLSVISCVPPRQYAELKQKTQECDTEREELRAENEKLSVYNTELVEKLKELEIGLANLSKDSLKRNESLVKMNIEFKNLLDKYNRLKNSQDALLSGSERETKKLLQELQQTQDNLQKREDKLKELELSLDTKKRSLDQLKKDMEAQNKRLMELERIMNRKDSLLKALKSKVSNALLGFEGQGLTVKNKNGKVYVSLDEKLLFESGKFIVAKNGAEALKKLARVLEQNSDINILIEGHTDDVPYIADQSIQDNWDLSGKRANAVIRILLDNSKIDPKRLTAAGRSQYLPVDPTKTTEARAKNRRTEIILTPKLDELYSILND